MQLLRAILVFLMMWSVCFVSLALWQRMRWQSRLQLKKLLLRSSYAALIAWGTLLLIVWLF